VKTRRRKEKTSNPRVSIANSEDAKTPREVTG